jgi:hypothetical protein
LIKSAKAFFHLGVVQASSVPRKTHRSGACQASKRGRRGAFVRRLAWRPGTAAWRFCKVYARACPQLVRFEVARSSSCELDDNVVRSAVELHDLYTERNCEGS